MQFRQDVKLSILIVFAFIKNCKCLQIRMEILSRSLRDCAISYCEESCEKLSIASESGSYTTKLASGSDKLTCEFYSANGEQ